MFHLKLLHVHGSSEFVSSNDSSYFVRDRLFKISILSSRIYVFFDSMYWHMKGYRDGVCQFH